MAELREGHGSISYTNSNVILSIAGGGFAKVNVTEVGSNGKVQVYAEDDTTLAGAQILVEPYNVRLQYFPGSAGGGPRYTDDSLVTKSYVDGTVGNITAATPDLTSDDKAALADFVSGEYDSVTEALEQDHPTVSNDLLMQGYLWVYHNG